jgi:hypothetical protein
VPPPVTASAATSGTTSATLTLTRRAPAPATPSPFPAVGAVPAEVPSPVGGAPLRVIVPLLATVPLALATLWWNPEGGGAVAAWVEVLAWLAAVAASVAAAALAPRVPLAAVASVGAVAAAFAVYAANWSAVEPRSYFALHRPLFAGVGEWVRDGGLDAAGTEARSLPLTARPVGAHGARVVGRDGERPAVLVAQQGSSGGRGYVYFDGDPDAGVRIALGDRQERLVDGLYLGGGWWWF